MSIPQNAKEVLEYFANGTFILPSFSGTSIGWDILKHMDLINVYDIMRKYSVRASMVSWILSRADGPEIELDYDGHTLLYHGLKTVFIGKLIISDLCVQSHIMFTGDSKLWFGGSFYFAIGSLESMAIRAAPGIFFQIPSRFVYGVKLQHPDKIITRTFTMSIEKTSALERYIETISELKNKTVESFSKMDGDVINAEKCNYTVNPKGSLAIVASPPATANPKIPQTDQNTADEPPRKKQKTND